LPPVLREASRHGRVIDPLASGALEVLPRAASVLLIGTGLTAVDALARLDALGHTGGILCVSRHGRWPAVHRAVAGPPVPTIDVNALAHSPRRALRHLRERIAEHAAIGGDWRTLIDALRPHTAPTWRAWSERARRQALRHLRSPWDVHRHRMAPSAGVALAQQLAQPQVRTIAARVIACAPAGEGRLEVQLQPRGARIAETHTVDAVLICLAPSIALTQRDDDLARALLARDLAADDALGFGWRVDADGRTLDAAGRALPGLYALGPLLRARDWETTAVPEIREQAAALAARLLAV